MEKRSAFSGQLSARMVGAYKGAAASILLLLLIEGRPLSQGEMRRGTKYGDESINDAVYMLREDGLIVETSRYTWALLDGIRQLPIGSETAALPEKNLPEIAPDDPELDTMYVGMDDSISIQNESHTSIHGSSGNSGPAEYPLQCAAAADTLQQALSEAKIQEPALSRLTRHPGLTARAVRYHVGTAPSLGAAIWRMQHNLPVPREFEQEDDVGRHKYIGGAFADFISH